MLRDVLDHIGKSYLAATTTRSWSGRNFIDVLLSSSVVLISERRTEMSSSPAVREHLNVLFPRRAGTLSASNHGTRGPSKIFLSIPNDSDRHKIATGV